MLTVTIHIVFNNRIYNVNKRHRLRVQEYAFESHDFHVYT